MTFRILRLTCAVFFLSVLSFAQVAPFEQKGYIEYRAFGFPDTAYNDSGHIIGEAIIHYDVEISLSPRWTLKGATETRSDTHRQTEREFRLNIDDRGLQRPSFSIRSVSLEYHRGPITLEVGKQTIRWGRTSLLTPSDRFAPRDYLTVADSDVLAVHAARVEYKRGANTFETVVQPLFTPSRMPLLNQRWTVIPERFEDFPINDLGTRFPGGPQWGARWKHTSRRYETAVSFFDGFNHLPLFERPFNNGQIDFQRYFPRMRMIAVDAGTQLGKFLLKGEAAYFTSTTRAAGEYLLYVLQVEQKKPSWSWMAGYAGEHRTRRQTPLIFAPDRALGEGFLGQASYNLTKTRSIAAETSAGRNGLWLKTEYSEEWNKRWSGKVGFTLLEGKPTDFFGQYRRNTFFNLSLRYGF